MRCSNVKRRANRRHHNALRAAGGLLANIPQLTMHAILGRLPPRDVGRLACSSSRVGAAVCTVVPMEDVAAEAAAAAAEAAAKATAIEEELREKRLQWAVENYLKKNGVESGASYRNIARRHGVPWRELRDEVAVLALLQSEREKYSDSD